jgi:hypothetical protein
MNTRMRRPDRAKLIKYLRDNVHARLGESDVHGIGVMALHDIEPDTEIFAINKERNLQDPPPPYVELTEECVKGLPSEVAKYIRDLIIPCDGNFAVPAAGLNALDPSYFLNATMLPEQANVKFLRRNDLRGLKAIVASRLIKKGEELLLQAKGDPSEDCAAAYAGAGEHRDSLSATQRMRGLVAERSSLHARLKQATLMQKRLEKQIESCTEEMKLRMPPASSGPSDVKTPCPPPQLRPPRPNAKDLNRQGWARFEDDKAFEQVTLTMWYSAEERSRRARSLRKRKPKGRTPGLANATRGCYMYRFPLDGGAAGSDYDYVSEGDTSIQMWRDEEEEEEDSECNALVASSRGDEEAAETGDYNEDRSAAAFAPETVAAATATTAAKNKKKQKMAIKVIYKDESDTESEEEPDHSSDMDYCATSRGKRKCGSNKKRASAPQSNKKKKKIRVKEEPPDGVWWQR